MANLEFLGSMRINSFVEIFETKVSRAVAQLVSNHTFIDTTDVIIDRFGSDYHVIILLDFSITGNEMTNIADKLGDFYWMICPSLDSHAFQIKIWDSEINKYFRK